MSNAEIETFLWRRWKKIIAAFQVPAIEVFRFDDETEHRKALDEHMALISNKSAEEIAAITRVVREVIAAMGID